MNKLVLFSSTVAGTLVFLSTALAQTYHFLDPFEFGVNGDGSIKPGERSYLTTGSFQRGLAYNPATGNLILIDRAAGPSGSPIISGGIHVIDYYGYDVGTLSTNGMDGGTFADLAVGVTDNGVVYVGNLVNDGTSSPFKLYRWESDLSVNPPVVAFSGDPGHGKAQRWGDTMDIRGSGTGTQILLGTRNPTGGLGTNVAILTTADGVNFTATTIATDVAGENATGGGIAFGIGNTFWAKNVDSPLRLFSFDLSSGQATTLHSYGTDVLAGSRTLEALAVDTANNYLGIVDFTGVDRVRLYDISDLNQPPVLLDMGPFTVDNANSTGSKGYIDFGGGSLFVHSINNGIMGFFINESPLNPPVIAVQPASPGRVLSGRAVKFDVVAYPKATYQWQRSGVDITGATNAVLNITNVQTSDAGLYRVLARNAAGTTPSAEVLMSVVNAADLFHLTSLWSAAPGAQPYVTSTGGANTPNERGIAYNALSNQLHVVQRSGNNYTVHVIDAATGTKLYNLKTNGILPVIVSEVSGANGIGLVAISVAEDGAVYACNGSPNAYGGNPLVAGKLFRVYRWANSDSNTLPVEIFQGDPAAQTTAFRWGDALSARGSGVDTQLILDNQNASARFLSILRPADASMASFLTQSATQDLASIPGTSIGRTLQFGAGNTFWQKRKAAGLVQSSFDPNAVLATYTNLPTAIGEVGLDLTRHLLAGINYVTVTTVPDTLDLYDFSDPTMPSLLGQYNFPINHQANANFIGQVVMAGDKIFALDGNNGMVAFRIVSGAQSPPVISGQPQNLKIVAGNSGSLSVFTPDLANFQWQLEGANLDGATNASYTITNATANDVGAYRVLVSNEAGTVPSSTALVTVLSAEGFARLSPCWSLAPQSRGYLPKDSDSQGRTPLYRGIAYNALSNQVYIISRTGPTAGLTIHVLDAASGADLYELNTSGITGGTIILLAMAVAADGALYAANMSDANSGQNYKIYRWENSDPNTVPVQMYAGDPGAALTTALRWGDTLEVRGSGVDTEILTDANVGTVAALFKPTDATMTAFVPSAFSQTYGNGSIGRSLEFGTGPTFWQKRAGARLQLSQYDLPGQTSSALTNYANFLASLGPVAVDLAHKVLVGINFASSTSVPDTLDLYDIADFNNPLRIAGYNFPVNHVPNGNLIGQVFFAGNKVYAVDGDNGVVAFTLTLPTGPHLTITRSEGNVILSWPLSATGYILQKNTTLSPLDWANSQDPTPVNGQNTVSEDGSSGKAFYRLRKQ